MDGETPKPDKGPTRLVISFSAAGVRMEGHGDSEEALDLLAAGIVAFCTETAARGSQRAPHFTPELVLWSFLERVTDRRADSRAHMAKANRDAMVSEAARGAMAQALKGAVVKAIESPDS